MKSLGLPVLACVALQLCACDSQVDDSYRGEPLLVVRGQVLLGPAHTLARTTAVDAALLWAPANTARLQKLMMAEKVPVQAKFPARFAFAVVRPPPLGALREDGGVRYGCASVGAVDRSARLEEINNGAGLLALANDQSICHFDHDVQAGTALANVYGTLSKGFHMLRLHIDSPSQTDPPAFERCVVDKLAEGAATGETQADAESRCEIELTRWRFERLPPSTEVILTIDE